MSNYKFVEFFAGCGGTALGLENAGMACVFLNEINPAACRTLRLNRPNWNVVEGDISGIDFSAIPHDIDLLSGYFPLQPFSSNRSETGLERTLGNAFVNLTRAINEIKPKIIMLENLPALLTLNKGEHLKEVSNTLDNLGYFLLEPKVMNTKDYEVPLNRRRLILIGIRQDLYQKSNFYWPEKSNRIMTLRDAFCGGSIFDSDVPQSEGAKYSKVVHDMMSNIPPGKTGRHLPEELQSQHPNFFKCLRRLSMSEPSSAAIYDRIRPASHPVENRPLQTRECARILTFPDCWDFAGSTSQIYRQLNSAFPVKLSFSLGKSIVNFLDQLASESENGEISKMYFEGFSVLNILDSTYDYTSTTLDEYIFDGLRMLAKNKDNFIKNNGEIHKENKINLNLSGCLTRFEVDCTTEADGNGRCDLLLNGKINQEIVSAIIECKKVLETDSDIIFGKKLSSALEQIDSYGEIRSNHSKYIVLYIIDRSVNDIHKLFEKLRNDNESLSFLRVKIKNNGCSMYCFRDKKIVLRTLRTTSPSEVFEESELSQQIHNVLKHSHSA